MEADRVSSLWECITIIESQQMLKELTVQDWSNMKRNQRQKLHKDLYRKAYPSFLSKKKKITIEDLKRMQGV